MKYTYITIFFICIGCLGAPAVFAQEYPSEYQDGSSSIGAEVVAICGNGDVDQGETCDDGNRASGDGCSAVCQTEGGTNEPIQGGGGGGIGGGVVGGGNNVGGANDGGADIGGNADEGGAEDGGVDIGGNDDGGDGGAPDGNDNGGADIGGNNIDGGNGGADIGGGTNNGGQGGGNNVGGGTNGGGAGNGGSGNTGGTGGPVTGGGGGGTNGADTGGQVEEPSVEIPTQPSVVIEIGDFLFFVGPNIPITFHNGALPVLSNTRVKVVLPYRNVSDPSQINQIILSVRGEQFVLEPSLRDEGFVGYMLVPGEGLEQVTVDITLEQGKKESHNFFLNLLGYGQVYDEQSKEPLDGALVSIMYEGRIVAVTSLGESLETDADGLYAFITAPGLYQVRVEKDGYRPYVRTQVEVLFAVFSEHIPLIKKTPTIASVVNPEASVSENVVAIAQNIGERAQEQFAVAKEEIKKRIEQTKLFIDDPEVEQLQEDVIAPTVVTVSAVSIIPSLFGILIPLLRFLFLQPLLFLGLRKRDAWGVVYNAYTKLPVDLVTVRLIDIKTNRPKKAVVTDKEGRFWFTADPGEYRIEISKQNFAFPSEVVPQGNIDGKFIDVYHGGTIQVSEEGAAITPSIPIDPHGRHKTPLRVRLEAFGHQLQHSIAAIGIIATFISFLIAPSVLLFGYLVVHIGLYFVFSEFVKPQKPKGWGMIYDGKSKEPVKHAVARLFTAEYDKLVATQITDGKGRYAFLVGPNDYYVRVEKTGYEELVRENIHIADQDESVIKEDLSLKPILAGDEQKQDEKNVL